ncbi:MAG: hypothetical protein LUE89_07585 [Clostridiales bacterium]|nr:hypothetical protein [Clostridiales bacterium]
MHTARKIAVNRFIPHPPFYLRLKLIVPQKGGATQAKNGNFMFFSLGKISCPKENFSNEKFPCTAAQFRRRLARPTLPDFGSGGAVFFVSARNSNLAA